jgi:polyisoprenyl-teichoic acid--peptidoglycan teichoic acid transferase
VRRHRRQPRTWGQRLILLVSGGLVTGLLATAAGLGYAYAKYSRLARVELGSVLTERSSSDSPQNFLLVGVDSAASLDEDDPVRDGRSEVGGLRSDTMMILRVDPASERASLLSLPRDLWVPLASGGNQRINAAIQHGGPEELIDTIEEYLGIPINHYVQVDFGGFRDLVAVIDGVEVYFDHAARDRNSGLVVEQPGCVMLSPDQALAYVRSRHYQSYRNGRWRTDPTGDLGRISRQQDFIVRALRRAVDKGIRNPVTLDNLVDAALDTVTVDDLLKADDIIDLASRFRGFNPDLLDLYALPIEDDTVGGAAILRLVDTRAQPILDLFRGTSAAAVTPDGVRVRVLNGSGVPGQAGGASDALVAAGFTSAGTGEAETFEIPRTVVRYPAGQEAAADLVARHLVAGAALEAVEGSVGADVVLVTGADFAGVRAAPLPATPTTPGTGPPSTTTSTTGSTTTTSVLGYVPEAPPGSGC